MIDSGNPGPDELTIRPDEQATAMRANDPSELPPDLSRRQFLGAVGAGAILATRKVAVHRPTAKKAGTTLAPSSPATSTTAGTAPAVPLPTATAVRVPATPGVLVVVTLYGGNDGLNTVIPLDAGPYIQGRGALAYTGAEAIALGDGLGLHPALTGLKTLWDRRQLAIIRGVGYPNPSRSHFRSQDIWQSAAPSTYVSTGWLGRWYDTAGNDPLGMVAVASSIPRSMVGAKGSAVVVPVGNVRSSISPDQARGVEIMSRLDDSLGVLASRVRTDAADLGRVDTVFGPMLAGQASTTITAASLEPGAANRAANELDLQLNVVARLIRAGAPTRVYAVSLGGFDTHANEKANHARLMGIVDQALNSFVNLMSQDQASQNVTLMVTSEFGRRLAANGSGGTDHGTAAPVFVMGPKVKGGFYGDQPSLTDLDQGDLKFTTDFRAVYATILAGVLGADPGVAIDAPFPNIGFV